MNNKLAYKHIAAVLVIILLGAACYSNAVNSDFVWDDEAYIVFNPAVKTLKNIASYFTDYRTFSFRQDMSNDAFRPLMVLSYAIDYRLFKLDPSYYHLENIIFHICNAILLYFLLYAIFSNGALSIIAALIFLTHPAQTEAVSWISGRSTVLFTFFYLVAFLLYVKYGKAPYRKPFFYLSLLFFLFAVLSKEMAATLPFALILYGIYLKKDKWKLIIKKTRMYFIILGGYVLYRYSVLGLMSQQQYWGGSFYRTMLTMTKGILYYLRVLFLPVKLCAGYVIPISRSIFEPFVLFSISILALIGWGFIVASKKNKIAAFSTAFFFVSLLPVLNIFPVKFIVVERALYLPSIGFCILIGSAISKVFPKKLMFILTAVLVCGLAARTYARNYVWKDRFALFSSITQSSPYNFLAKYNLANVYYGRGDYKTSAALYQKVVEWQPNYMEAHLGLANAYHSMGRLEDALAEYKEALGIEPTPIIYNSMGVLFFDQSKYEKAVSFYKKALGLKQNYANAYINLGNVYYKLRRKKKLIA